MKRINQIKEVFGCEEANKLLNEGWKLMELCPLNGRFAYCLGFNNSSNGQQPCNPETQSEQEESASNKTNLMARLIAEAQSKQSPQSFKAFVASLTSYLLDRCIVDENLFWEQCAITLEESRDRHVERCKGMEDSRDYHLIRMDILLEIFWFFHSQTNEKSPSVGAKE